MTRFIVIQQDGPTEYTDGYELPRSREEALQQAIESDHACTILQIDHDLTCHDLSRELVEEWYQKNANRYFADEMNLPQFCERYLSARRVEEDRGDYHQESRFEAEHERSYSRIGL